MCCLEKVCLRERAASGRNVANSQQPTANSQQHYMADTTRVKSFRAFLSKFSVVWHILTLHRELLYQRNEEMKRGRIFP